MEVVFIIIGIILYIIQLATKANQKQLQNPTPTSTTPNALEDWLKTLEQVANDGKPTTLPTAPVLDFDTQATASPQPDTKPTAGLNDFLKGRHFYDSDQPKKEEFTEKNAYYDQKAKDYDTAAQDYDKTGRDLDLNYFGEDDFEKHVFGQHPSTQQHALSSITTFKSRGKANTTKQLFASKRQIRNAFIMSEVLSKPKSKR